MTNQNQIEPVSLAVELTDAGVKASIMSRAVSAWDRLFGARADKRRAPIDADIAETNAVSAARVKMIDALGDLGVERLRTDPEFAARAVENFLPGLMRKQENKDAILELAAEDLRQNPGSEPESADGPETLSDDFLNRFERYAEDASDEEVRERWAKVLTSEIRKPGTFPAKVMRIIDELDKPLAEAFERFCRFRMERVVLKSLCGKLPFMEQTGLVSAGLLTEPGMGQIRRSVEVTTQDGMTLWFFAFNDLAVAVEKTDTAAQYVENTYQLTEGSLSLPAFVLTDAGSAIASLIEDRTDLLTEQLADQLASAIPQSEVRRYARFSPMSEWRMIAQLPARQTEHG